MYYQVPQPALGLWWWFYNTPKNQHVLNLRGDSYGNKWTAVRYLTDSEAQEWYYDHQEALFSGAPYQYVTLYKNDGRGWRAVSG